MERVMDGIRRFGHWPAVFCWAWQGDSAWHRSNRGSALAPITGIRIIMDIRGMERQAAEKNPNARSKRRMKSAVQGPVYPAPCGGDKDLQ